MKKRMIVLMALTLSMATSASAWAGAFDNFYDYENPDGMYSYFFTEGSFCPGIFVTIDKDWYQNARVVTSERGATFYHTDSYNSYAEEGLEGGRLFTIGACVNSDFRNLPSFEYIGFDEDSCLNFYAELPTDYQAYAEDESIRTEYDALWAGVRDVIAGIKILSGSRGMENQETSVTSSTESTFPATWTDFMPETEPQTVIKSGDYEYIVNADAKTITISDYIGTEDVVEIPAEIDGYQVTDIGEQAFSYKKMKRLSFPDSIRRIGQRAFEYCEVPEVTIPAGATVESRAFGYSDALKKVILEPGAVIKSRAFGYCDDLETVVCAAGSRLEEDTFEYCHRLGKVILCGEVEADEDAFYDCDSAEMIRVDESDYENWKQPDQDSVSADVESFLTGGVGVIPETEALEEGEHRITLTGDMDVFVDCPTKAKAGDLVAVSVAGVCDGVVKLEVNGSDSGKWQNWGTYIFTMPDEDVEIKGWISTAGYPGA